MNDDNIKIDDLDLSSLGELAAVDEIINNAVAATDSGNYREALDGFEHALEVTQRIFGDNIKLNELKQKIAEIQKLLEEKESQ